MPLRCGLVVLLGHALDQVAVTAAATTLTLPSPVPLFEQAYGGNTLKLYGTQRVDEDGGRWQGRLQDAELGADDAVVILWSPPNSRVYQGSSWSPQWSSWTHEWGSAPRPDRQFVLDAGTGLEAFERELLRDDSMRSVGGVRVLPQPAGPALIFVVGTEADAAEGRGMGLDTDAHIAELQTAWTNVITEARKLGVRKLASTPIGGGRAQSYAQAWHCTRTAVETVARTLAADVPWPHGLTVELYAFAANDERTMLALSEEIRSDAASGAARAPAVELFAQAYGENTLKLYGAAVLPSGIPGDAVVISVAAFDKDHDMPGAPMWRAGDVSVQQELSGPALVYVVGKNVGRDSEVQTAWAHVVSKAHQLEARKLVSPLIGCGETSSLRCTRTGVTTVARTLAANPKHGLTVELYAFAKDEERTMLQMVDEIRSYAVSAPAVELFAQAYGGNTLKLYGAQQSDENTRWLYADEDTGYAVYGVTHLPLASETGSPLKDATLGMGDAVVISVLPQRAGSLVQGSRQDQQKTLDQFVRGAGTELQAFAVELKTDVSMQEVGGVRVLQQPSGPALVFVVGALGLGEAESDKYGTIQRKVDIDTHIAELQTAWTNVITEARKLGVKKLASTLIGCDRPRWLKKGVLEASDYVRKCTQTGVESVARTLAANPEYGLTVELYAFAEVEERTMLGVVDKIRSYATTTGRVPPAPSVVTRAKSGATSALTVGVTVTVG